METPLTDIDLAMNSIKEQLLQELSHCLGSNKEENTTSLDSQDINS